MSYFSIQLTLLHLLGFRSDQTTFVVKIQKILNVFSIIFCCSAEGWFIINNLDNILVSVEAAVLIFITLTSFVKLVFYWMWQEKLLILMKKIEKMASKGRSRVHSK
jgi:hypothetical protein